MSKTELRNATVVTVVNETKRTQLGDQVVMARSFLQRGRGLMFRSDLPEGSGLIIDPCSSIHTMWMRFPIDVVYVDDDGKIIRADRAMKPWRFGPLFVRGRYVVELPPGTLASSNTECGDHITMKPV